MTEKKTEAWKATPESKAKAKKLRVFAVLLWLLGIALEVGAIFGLLLNKSILTVSAKPDDRGVLTTTESFPTWALLTLIALLILDGVVVVIGSMLWKKANQFDPASEKDKVKFFVQNQLGAAIPLIAFVPIIVLILMNEDMDKKQKTIASAVGVVVAIAAALLGADYDPPSVEKYTAEKQAVVQLLGEDTVYWAGGGQVYHVCGDVSDLKSSEVSSGTTAEAVEAGKPRLTLKIESELEACGRAVPTNIADIVDAIREVQEGTATEQILPSPTWANASDAPTGDEVDALNDALEGYADAS
ncbi:MAG: hypothetical protein QM621_14445 [Aeromicrobium sp.]|uniref:hypothetical protein n=1 Tax=Aeromicrobium sp. TaxID=1871063 RepID=UPI0039E4BDA3